MRKTPLSDQATGVKGAVLNMGTKKLRIAGALVLVLGILGGALIWLRPGNGFTTSAECLSAYYEACQAGDVARYLRCLGEPLSSESRGRLEEAGAGGEALRRQAVRSWVQDGAAAPTEGGVRIEVDEIRAGGVRRVQFRLERSRSGWLIVAITPLAEKQPPFPYGTDVRTGPETNPQR